MSVEAGRVACLLLEESFGKIVGRVGSYLIARGEQSLPNILKGVDLDKEQVMKSLCVLIQHHLVTYQEKKKHTAMYRTDVDSVLLRVHFPRWILTAKALFGDAGEVIVESILQQGHAFMSQTVEVVSKRFEEAGMCRSEVMEIVKKQFKALTEGQFLTPVTLPNSCPDKVEAGASKEDKSDPTETTGSKRKRKGATEEKDEPKAKKKKVATDLPQEDDVMWQVNSDRFQQHLRDEAIVAGVLHQIDDAAANVMKTILCLASNSSHPATISTSKTKPVYTHQIHEALSGVELSREVLEQYLKVLSEQQNGFLQKMEDSGGGAYVVNFKNCSELLCQAAIECIVKERFGSKALRVFRLLLLKKMLEQKQVPEKAMVPSKEAKEILYTLLAERFVSLQEIPKTPDYAPSRTFYLFSVRLLPVAIMLRERCLKALGNLMVKNVTITKDNKRLLERSQLQERQQAEIERGEAVEEEVEEILTPDEKKQVEVIKMSVAKLEHAELELQETIMTIDNYIKLSTH